jgi:hypothetical protein
VTSSLTRIRKPGLAFASSSNSSASPYINCEDIDSDEEEQNSIGRLTVTCFAVFNYSV